MKIAASILLLCVLSCGASAQLPPRPDEFFAGLYADGSRARVCVSGPEGSNFDMFAWAWVPLDEGLTYVTLRFDFPSNIDLSGRAAFNDLVIDVIVIDYDDGTVEWTMLFSECPSGWIQLFRQECVILDASRADVGITADHSMMRDCDFVLNSLEVLNDLALNDSGCVFVPVRCRHLGSLEKPGQAVSLAGFHSSDRRAQMYSRRSLSSHEKGPRSRESISSSPTIIPSQNIGTTISETTSGAHAR